MPTVPSRLTSVPDLTTAFVAEWANPPSHASKSSDKRTKMASDVQKVHMAVMDRCLQTFGHVVYIASLFGTGSQ